MTIEVKQESYYRGNNWWNWTVWIEGPKEVMDQIKYVEYTLHPTFPQPVHRIENHDTGFRLEATGWGGFMIYIEIKYNDGRAEKLSHQLTLKYPKKEEPTSGRQKKVYISSGVADESFARALYDELCNKGINAVMLHNQLSSLPFEASLNSLLENVTHAVIIISDRTNPWLAREIEVIEKLEPESQYLEVDPMRKHKISIIPVIIGADAKVPEKLKRYKGINVEHYHKLAAKDVSAQIEKLIDQPEKG